MITANSNVASATAALAGLAAALAPTVDGGIEAGLEELIHTLEATTPVRTGHLKASWFTDQQGPGSWLFGDTADYASYVAQTGTSRMQANAALKAALDGAESTIEDTLHLAITRLLAVAP